MWVEKKIVSDFHIIMSRLFLKYNDNGNAIKSNKIIWNVFERWMFIFQASMLFELFNQCKIFFSMNNTNRKCIIISIIAIILIFMPYTHAYIDIRKIYMNIFQQWSSEETQILFMIYKNILCIDIKHYNSIREVTFSYVFAHVYRENDRSLYPWAYPK